MIVDAYVRVAREISGFEDDQAKRSNTIMRAFSAAFFVSGERRRAGAQTLVTRSEVKLADSRLAWSGSTPERSRLARATSSANVDK